MSQKISLVAALAATVAFANAAAAEPRGGGHGRDYGGYGSDAGAGQFGGGDYGRRPDRRPPPYPPYPYYGGGWTGDFYSSTPKTPPPPPPQGERNGLWYY